MTYSVAATRINDDPACVFPKNCHRTGTGLCRPCAVRSGKYHEMAVRVQGDPVQREKIRLGSNRRWADPTSRQLQSEAMRKSWSRKERWRPPSSLATLYEDLRRKLRAPRKARELVQAHMALKGIGST